MKSFFPPISIAVNKNLSENSRIILGMRIDYTSYEKATKQIINFSITGQPAYVCAGNVHMMMEAYDNPEFGRVVNSADLITPDGMPLVWALKILGINKAERVYGPSLLLTVCQKVQELKIPVGFYGGTKEVLDSMLKNLKFQFLQLQINYVFAPPFRPLTLEEDEKITKDIIRSGIKILFVGIGCPKQEKWMFAHTKRISAVMIGVGAAFDFISGNKPQAPPWIQNIGLEWLFRLFSEPKRLWKRYLYQNPRFVYLFIKELILYYLDREK